MKKVFVFCIGGTGMRVMKAVTMLLAAGMNTNGYAIVPILVDPHRDLDERKGLNTLLEDYRSIYKLTVQHDSETLNPLDGFFATKMPRLKELNNQQNDTDEMGGDERRFGDYIKANLSDDDPNKYLVQTLFSQKNLNSKLAVGFKGNPNVGTVILSDMVEGANWFKAFKDNFYEGDRVFIISSIFGGTGASGYPLIEKKIRESKDYPLLSQALLGAVTVLPYFSLEDPGVTNSDIDSTTFLTKAKSALAYYEDTVQSDYLYYAGEQTENWATYANNEAEQKDQAHFIELVAASALFDFLGREKQDTNQYMSRAIRQNVSSLDRVSLTEAYDKIVKPLADFTLLRLLTKVLPKEEYFPLKVWRSMDDSFYHSNDFGKLSEFLDKFKGWYDDLATNNRAFAPLYLDNEKDISGWIKQTSSEMKDVSYLLLGMIQASRAESEKHDNCIRHLLNFAHKAINQYTNVLIPEQTNK